MIQFKYPIGPLSLVELEDAKALVRYREVHGWFGREPVSKDPYDIGVKAKAEGSLQLTFGHIDIRTRRWYRDLWGARQHEFGIPLKS
jgi:hypothetical protein